MPNRKRDNLPDVRAGLAAPMPQTGAQWPHQVKVKEVATGRVFAAWPVDAKELVSHPKGEHVLAGEDEELTP